MYEAVINLRIEEAKAVKNPMVGVSKTMSAASGTVKPIKKITITNPPDIPLPNNSIV